MKKFKLSPKLRYTKALKTLNLITFIDISNIISSDAQATPRPAWCQALVRCPPSVFQNTDGEFTFVLDITAVIIFQESYLFIMVIDEKNNILTNKIIQKLFSFPSIYSLVSVHFPIPWSISCLFLFFCGSLELLCNISSTSK